MKPRVASVHYSCENPSVRETGCWMRSVSFGALHRILKLVAEHPNGLRPVHLNQLITGQSIIPTQRSSKPSPTRLYHYRNTLVKLNAIRRYGPHLCVDIDNPSVRHLLKEDAPTRVGERLTDAAKFSFAQLVLSNSDCRSRFFDLFSPCARLTGDPLHNFCTRGLPVTWVRRTISAGKEVRFTSHSSHRVLAYMSHSGINATLYGLRYWARDELTLIDEYSHRSGRSATMFPLSPPGSNGSDGLSVLDTVRHLLALRSGADWTTLSIAELIERYCVGRREPIHSLFSAIDWLIAAWPSHIILIHTSRGLASLGSRSLQSQRLALRSYYKGRRGAYVSHVRLHRHITLGNIGGPHSDP